MSDEIVHFVSTLDPDAPESPAPVLCRADKQPNVYHLAVDTDPHAVTCQDCRGLLGDARLLEGMPETHTPTVDFIREVAGWTEAAREATYKDMGLTPLGREMARAASRVEHELEVAAADLRAEALTPGSRRHRKQQLLRERIATRKAAAAAPPLLDGRVPTLAGEPSAQEALDDLHARIRAAVSSKPKS
jgi:hypothetical protein